MSTNGNNNVPTSDNINVGQLTALLKGKSATPATAQGKKPDASKTTPAPTEQAKEEVEEIAGEEGTPAEDETAAETETETTVENPGTETEEETSEETQTEEEEQGEEEEEDPKESRGVKGLQKRVNKLTAQRKELEQKLVEANQKLAQAAQAPAGPSGQGRFANDTKLRQIDSSLAETEAILNWAEENPEGGDLAGEGGKSTTFTPAQVKQIRRNAEAKRIQLSADRSSRVAGLETEFKQAQNQAYQQAVKVYPWMKDEKSPEFQDASEVLRMIPALRDMADAPLAVGDYVRGMRMRLAEAKKAPGKTVGAPMTKPKGSSNPTNVVTHTPAAAPKVNGKQKVAQDAGTQFQKSGKTGDLAKMFATKQQARQA